MAILTATLKVQMLVGRGMTKQFKMVWFGFFGTSISHAVVNVTCKLLACFALTIKEAKTSRWYFHYKEILGIQLSVGRGSWWIT